MNEIKIIPLEGKKPSDDRMITVEVTIPRSDYNKLTDFMNCDTWEKVQAIRHAKLNDCINSLQEAVTIAMRHVGTSSGRTFATLLASMYNGNRVKFDVSDLKLLDGVNFEHAINSMRLCQETHREPHQFFVDGGDLFESMISKWGLEKKRRAAR